MTNTKDSLKLMQFLEKYPNQWHSLATNKQTVRAFERLQALYGVYVYEFDGFTNQMRFVPSELLKIT
jgi:hypothetical protein